MSSRFIKIVSNQYGVNNTRYPKAERQQAA